MCLDRWLNVKMEGVNMTSPTAARVLVWKPRAVFQFHLKRVSHFETGLFYIWMFWSSSITQNRHLSCFAIKRCNGMNLVLVSILTASHFYSFLPTNLRQFLLAKRNNAGFWCSVFVYLWKLDHPSISLHRQLFGYVSSTINPCDKVLACRGSLHGSVYFNLFCA